MIRWNAAREEKEWISICPILSPFFISVDEGVVDSRMKSDRCGEAYQSQHMSVIMTVDNVTVKSNGMIGKPVSSNFFALSTFKTISITDTLSK